jgi:hypothetical protein
MSELGTAAAVTYTGLPVSSGGAHSLGRTSSRSAHERTIRFLDQCTAPDGARAYAISFPADRVSPRVAPPVGLRDEVERRFGRAGDIPESRVGDALDFLDEIAPQPTNRYGMASVWLTMRCRFRLLDPATGRPLPGQDPQRFEGVEYAWSVPLGMSTMLLSLHDHATLALDLCIPDPTDDLLRRLIPWLASNLPFRFSPKHWRAWTPTKAGALRDRKLEPFW